MPYTVQSWVPGNGGGTPLGATRMNHIEAGLGEHETRIAAIEADTGWVTIATAATFGAYNGGLQVRKIGKRVTCRYGFSNTGLTLSTASTVVAVGGIAAAYVPPGGWIGWAGTNSPANFGRVSVNPDGSVTLTPGGGAISTYFRLDPAAWLID